MDSSPDNEEIPDISSVKALRRRLAETEDQLAEALDTLEAIRSGEVDALVVGDSQNRQIYTLQTADRPYRTLIENMREGAVMLGAGGIILYCNQALAEIVQARPESLVGQAFVELVDPADRESFSTLLDEGGRMELGLRLGEIRAPTLISLERLSAETGDMACGVITDLTEAKLHAQALSDARANLAAESATRESDERYRLILESATDYGIFATDLEGRVTIWNTGAENILQWRTDEIIGEPAPLIWTPEDRTAGVPELEMKKAVEMGRAEDERWHLRKDGSRFWANGLMMPLRDEAGDHIGFLKILRDRTDQRRADENQRTLINELNHRVKNTLATVQSIATQTLRTEPSPEKARKALGDRLVALSRAHDVLTRESWEGAELDDIVEQAVMPYRDRNDRITGVGPPIRLSPRLALAIAMALQELATNAAKYGALSNTEGHIDVTWTLKASDKFTLIWRETGGPPVIPPQRRGFGSRLIERTLSADLEDGAEIDFAPEGVVCTIKAKLDTSGDL